MTTRKPFFKPRTIVRNPIDGKAVRVLKVEGHTDYLVFTGKKKVRLPVGLVDEGSLAYDDVVTHMMSQRIYQEVESYKKGSERA